jgi:hypothetical protein
LPLKTGSSGLSEVRRHCSLLCGPISLPSYTSPHDRHFPSFFHSSMAIHPLLGTLAAVFSFVIVYTVGRTPWTGDQPIAVSLSTHWRSQIQNKRTQISGSNPRAQRLSGLR